MRNDLPLIDSMFENFFNNSLNSANNDPEAFYTIIEYCLEQTSPYLSTLRDELRQYLNQNGNRTEWRLQEDFQQAFDPSIFGLTGRGFVEMMIEAIDAVPEDYFPTIDNMILGGLHQDIDCYGSTLKKWLDSYWDQFKEKDFVKLKEEIERFCQYHGCNLEAAYNEKYGNDFAPNLGSTPVTADVFFKAVIELIDDRIRHSRELND